VIGMILQLADVPRAGLLAFAVMMLGILQIGSAVVVIPVLIWLWATRDFGTALLITVLLVPASLQNRQFPCKIPCWQGILLETDAISTASPA